eukprot:5467919-Prymnesium_polylepis.2
MGGMGGVLGGMGSGVGGAGSVVVAGERVLSLKQMREMIDEVYTSKAKHDQKCADAKLARETMEVHLYTFLNTKCAAHVRIGAAIFGSVLPD